jgi:putative endonuclease
MLASRRNGTLYVGVTSYLARRVWEHRQGFIAGFTKDYAVDKLVWFETYESAYEAISREKQLKKWNREWKIRLIEEMNPYWVDLSETIY